VDDILGGKDTWENVDRTEVTCPDTECGNGMAFFYQLQIRSADEPMTSFFKVCVRVWKVWDMLTLGSVRSVRSSGGSDGVG
jgi:DNA-directed RNA polymerase III subunit RPC11